MALEPAVHGAGNKISVAEDTFTSSASHSIQFATGLKIIKADYKDASSYYMPLIIYTTAANRCATRQYMDVYDSAVPVKDLSANTNYTVRYYYLES